MMKPKKTFKGHKKVGPGFPFDVSFVKKQSYGQQMSRNPERIGFNGRCVPVGKTIRVQRLGAENR